jgi:hypothetical protein
MLTFELRLEYLIADTAVPDWDEEGGCAIPAGCWEPVREIVMLVRTRLQGLPDPHPSASGDGSRHLRWAFRNNRFDVELVENGAIIWARRIGQTYSSGKIGSPEELLELLKETFNV